MEEHLNNFRRSFSESIAGLDASPDWLEGLSEGHLSPRCRTPVTTLTRKAFTFSDIDLLESGGAKETLCDQYLSPSENKNQFTYCNVRRQDKDKFWLYSDDENAFMLSAKRVGKAYYISQYSEFPGMFESEFYDEYERSNSSYCSVMRLNEKTKQFMLYNRTCEGCDTVLGKHTCGAQSVLNGERQLLATIRHFVEAVEAGDTHVDCNAVEVNMPTVYDDNSRDVWCARNRDRAMLNEYASNMDRIKLERANSQQSIDLESKEDERLEEQARQTAYIPGSKSSKLKNYKSIKNLQNVIAKSNNNNNEEEEEAKPEDTSIPESDSGSLCALAGEAGNKCKVFTKRPRYDSISNSLRMKFRDNRVRLASSKNMIFCINEDGRIDERMKNSAESERCILQFGKVSSDRFNLDFRFPLAPVQAFAMALSLFDWQAQKG